MSVREECRRVADLLDRFDQTEARAQETDSIAAHLESCPDCGAMDHEEQRALEDVLARGQDVPGDASFEDSASRIMAAVQAEPEPRRRVPPRRPASREVAQSLRRSGRASRAVRAEPRRARLSGGVLALAAGVVLLVASVMLTGRPEPALRVVAVEPAVAVVSVEGIDVRELAASDDAWLVARYDIFDLELGDTGGELAVEELSDDELDALEGAFGSAPSLG